MFYTNKNYTVTKIMVISALLLSMAIGINYFKFYVPIAGTQSVRVALGSPFLRFIGILFGPGWGGIAPALSDVIGYLLNPTGPYIWPLTLVAFFKGFSSAFLWHRVKNINLKAFIIYYFAVFLGILALGTFNLIYTLLYPKTTYVAFFEKRLEFISIGFIICGVAGLIVYFIALSILRNKHSNYFERFIKLIVSIGIPGFIFSTVNTFVLIRFYGWETPFIIIWIPRLVEQFFEVLYCVSALVLFCVVYERVFFKLD